VRFVEILSKAMTMQLVAKLLVVNIFYAGTDTPSFLFCHFVDEKKCQPSEEPEMFEA
jgi:hypothetical protein